MQPRVLSRDQIGGLAKRLEDWVARLDVVENRLVEENGDAGAQIGKVPVAAA